MIKQFFEDVMNNKNVSKVMFVSSMAIFGTISLFVRNISLPSGEIALYRALIAIIIIGAYLLLKKQTIALGDVKKDLPLLLLSGIAMGINWIFFFEAFRYTSVSIATLSYYFAPVIVTVASSFIFKEKLGAKQIICFIMSTIGLVLITGVGSYQSTSDLIGILLGLGAAAFYATVILINKFIKSVDGINRTFMQFLASIVVLIPYVLLNAGINIGSITLTAMICLLVLGVIHTAITYCMYFSSIKELSGQSAAILSYIDPLVAVAVSMLLLNEKMNAWQYVGGALILGFTLINELPKKEKN